ncbi:MAG: PilZ domain-containing protein [Nitrospiraceae bacterium]|nr:PilZ domain-containing protein [Nitrospiraceae bacterium]
MNQTFRERRARRIPLQCPVYYSNGQFQTIGVAEDFNSSGGRIRGKELVTVDMELVVIIIQPTPEIPILIRRASVRWVRGSDFGISLSSVPPQAEDELKSMARVMLPGLWSCLN